MTIKLLILIIDHESQFWERACCGRDLDLGRINLLRLLLLAIQEEEGRGEEEAGGEEERGGGEEGGRKGRIRKAP